MKQHKLPPEYDVVTYIRFDIAGNFEKYYASLESAYLDPGMRVGDVIVECTESQRWTVSVVKIIE